MAVERTTVRLPAELMERARRKAVAGNSTLTALIERGLRQVVGGPASPRHVDLPVSRARGGTWPGIDLSNSAAIQDLDDRDMGERLSRP